VQHCPGKEILLVELAPRFNNNNKNNTILSLIIKYNKYCTSLAEHRALPNTCLVLLSLLKFRLDTTNWDIVYHNRIFFIPKIIVVFRADLHKMKIKHQIIGECATKPFFDLKKLTIITGS
jgi:hypothetical protein